VNNSNRKLFLGVFLTGWSVMVLELLGTRVVAPYMGSSLYVWTALIGVILGFLSLGYYLGGEWSQRGASYSRLASLVLYASAWVFMIALAKEILLQVLVATVASGYVQAVVAAAVLFGVPAFLLGAVSPYAARLLITSVNSSGREVGRLYAVSTLGSIVGTFAAGFWLVPNFGHLSILYLVVLTLVLVSLLFSLKHAWVKLLLAGLSFWSLSNPWTLPTPLTQSLILDTDTEYSRVWIQDFFQPDGTQRRLLTNGAHSSGIVLGQPEALAFDYYPYYDLMFWQHPAENVLMIGGAGMGYPRYALKEYPDLKLTVVEIDPDLYQLAVDELEFIPDERVKAVFTDGRVFLNQNRVKYDAILFDAFSTYTVPFHLVSREAVEQLSRSLTPEGMVIANVIGAIEGEKAEITKAVVATYRQVFAEVIIFAVANPENRDGVQNLILVAANKKLNFEQNQLAPLRRQLLANQVWVDSNHPGLSDDWSPADFYTIKLVTR
jgi:spermidine synthase